MRTRALRTAACAALALGLSASAARAQAPRPEPGVFSVTRFAPAPPGDRFESVLGAGVSGEELFRAALTSDYARAPRVLRDTPSPVIAHQLVLHANLSLALWERLLLSAALPVVLVDDGAPLVRPGPPAVSLAAPSAAGIGDILLGARVQLFGGQRAPAELAVGGAFWIASGRPADFTGDGSARAMPYVSGSLNGAHVAVGAHAGLLLQRSRDYVDVHLGRELRFGLAGAFVSSGERVQLGPELALSAPLTRGTGETQSLWSVELLGAGRVRVGDLSFGVAAGPGLVRGIGTPSLRALTTIAYAPKGEKNIDRDDVIDVFDACPQLAGDINDDPALNGCPSDRDEDGVLDAVDRCPDEPGIRSTDRRQNGCPVPTDRDGDGIPDELDACPDNPGPASADAKKNGCPPDRDGDGVVDSEDACPDVAGVDDVDPKRRGCPRDGDADGVPDAEDACPTRPGPANADSAKNGCPLDTDKDTIADDLDACPRERGPASNVAAKNGCPARARFGSAGVDLLEPLPFAAASAHVTRAMEPALRDVASVLADHPEVRRVAVEGAPGVEARRAAAVARWLAEHGVARDRLVVRVVAGARVRLRFADAPAPAR